MFEAIRTDDARAPARASNYDHLILRVSRAWLLRLPTSTGGDARMSVADKLTDDVVTVIVVDFQEATIERKIWEVSGLSSARMVSPR